MRIHLIYIFCFLQILCFFSQASLLKWHALSDFYREGCWYTISIQTNLDFPGSEQKIIAQSGNFEMCVLGKSVSQNQFFVYLLLPQPSFSLTLLDELGQVKEKIRENLPRLQHLSKSDCAIGVYGSFRLENQCKAWFYKKKKVWIQSFSSIPDSSGLDIFDIIVCESIPPRGLEKLQSWARAGGTLIFEASKNQKFLLQNNFFLPEKNWDFIREGIGLIGFWKSEILSETEILNFWQEWQKTRIFQHKSQALPESLFSPQSWDKKIRTWCYFFFLTFLICFYILCRYCFSRYSFFKTLWILGCFTGVSSSLLFLWLNSWTPANCQCLRFIFLGERASTSTMHHFFYSLRDQNFTHDFAHLPMPSYFLEKKIKITQKKNMWKIEIKNFQKGQSFAFKTQEDYNVVGKIQRFDDQICNKTSLNMTQCALFHQWLFYPLENFPIQETISLQTSPGQEHPLMEEIFFLRNQFRASFFLAQIQNPWENSSFASFQQKELVCFFLLDFRK